MTITNSPDPASLARQVRFIMVRPSHPGNVGAAARAIKTMGFSQLVLVAPRFDDITTQAEAVALASGATDVLEQTRIENTLANALAGTTLAYALTARPRDLGPPACDIRTAAAQASRHLNDLQTGQIALVLGTERSGLDNQDIALCQRICHIPANPDYSSLNVAQALQLAAWELRYALISSNGTTQLPATGRQSIDTGSLPASNDKIQALLTHLEQALLAIGFLDPKHPKKLMLRMRHLITRSQPDNDEVDMLRGVCTAILRKPRQPGLQSQINNNPHTPD